MGPGLYLGLSAPRVAASGPAGPLWSAATSGAIADPAAWSVTGSGLVISGGAMVFTGAVTGDTLNLTGAYKTAMVAAVPISTLLNVQIDITGWTAGASVRMQIHTSGFGPYGSVSGNGTQSFSLTSGSNTVTAALRMTGLTGAPYSYTITDIRIYA